MAVTYCENSDLVLDTGQDVSEFMKDSLNDTQINTRKDAARLRAYNKINDQHLIGRTLIPATHISGLREIEIDLVVGELMTGAFTMESSNMSEWAEKYIVRAKEALENLRFSASAEAAAADSQNTGNGTVSAIVTNDEFTMTELWILRATSATKFSVHGTLNKWLPQAEVDVQYPEKDWSGSIEDYGLSLYRSPRYEEFPISFLITAGATAFVQDDKFTFKTYSASFYRQRTGQIYRG